MVCFNVFVLPGRFFMQVFLFFLVCDVFPSRGDVTDSKDDEENTKTARKEMDALLGDLDDRHVGIEKSINGLTEKNDSNNLRIYMPSNNKN